MLALVHVSSRYDVRAVLDQARDEYQSSVAPRDFDVIEVPFPERGAPRLVEGGARPPREPRPDPENDAT
jgi:ribonuclease Z